MDVDGVSSEVNFVDFGSGVVRAYWSCGLVLIPSGVGSRCADICFSLTLPRTMRSDVHCSFCRVDA